MRFIEVVPDQVFDQVSVEGGCIFDIFLIMFKELGSYRAIKTFDMAIGLRVTWVVMEVQDGAVADGDGELFVELAAVVGLDVFDCEGSDLDKFIQEVGSVAAVEFVVDIGEAEAHLQIHRSDHVAFDLVLEDTQRVQLHKVTGLLRLVTVAAVFLLFGFASLTDQMAVAVDHREPQTTPWQLAGCFQIGDHATHRRFRHRFQSPFLAMTLQFVLHGHLAYSWSVNTVLADECDLLRGDLPLPPCMGRSAPGRQRQQIATALLQAFLPAEGAGAGHAQHHLQLLDAPAIQQPDRLPSLFDHFPQRVIADFLDSHHPPIIAAAAVKQIENLHLRLLTPRGV